MQYGGCSVLTFTTDGDKFTVIWDPDLVPPKAAEVCSVLQDVGIMCDTYSVL